MFSHLYTYMYIVPFVALERNRAGKGSAVLVDFFHNLNGLDIFKLFESLFRNLILRFWSSLDDPPPYTRPAVTKNPGRLPGLFSSWLRSGHTNGGVVTQWLLIIAVHQLPVLLRTPEFSVLNLYAKTDTRDFPLFI